MATAKIGSNRDLQRKRKSHLPMWLAVCLGVVIAVLIYGALTPSPPSAFDRPEAQSTGISPSPWQQVR